jgi:hypothetical protein
MHSDSNETDSDRQSLPDHKKDIEQANTPAVDEKKSGFNTVVDLPLES